MQKCKRGVIWKRSVAVYVAQGLTNVYQLEESLGNGTYKIDKYAEFEIHEPKHREILSTRIKDRVFQRSLCDNVVYPQITRSFIHDNGACQIGKGVDFALDRLDCLLHRYFRHYGKEGHALKCDVKGYFQNTRHDVAKKAVSKRVTDREAAIRVHEIIESYGAKYWRMMLEEYGIDTATAKKAAQIITDTRTRMVGAQLLEPERKKAAFRKGWETLAKTVAALPGLKAETREEIRQRVFTESARGIGLGSQASQLVELAVLDDLDHFIKEKLRIKYYIRYMDDFLLLHPDKEYLKYCKAEIEKKLAEIGLTLNEKTEMYPIKQGIMFLKWHFHLTATGKVIRKMNKKSIVKERRKLKKLKAMLEEGKITIQDVEANFQSWTANAKRGNTRNLLLEMKAYYFELFGEVYRNGRYENGETADQGTGAGKQ